MDFCVQKLVIQVKLLVMVMVGGLGAVSSAPAQSVDVPSTPGVVTVATPFRVDPDIQRILYAQDGQPPSPPGVTQSPQQQPPRTPRTRPRSRTPRLASRQRTTSTSRTRLASMPDMFGDTMLRGGTLSGFFMAQAEVIGTLGVVDLPTAGGSRGTLIGENNKALPVDRVYFNYHHFHNAFQAQATSTNGWNGQGYSDLSVDRYLFGWEQTFLDGQWSFELRMPFSNGVNYQGTVPAIPGRTISVSGGDVGNLTVILKRILYEDDFGVVSAGFGLETPTGSDASAMIGPIRYEVANQAFHISPFIALMDSPTDNFFYHVFFQLDIPTNGNTIFIQVPGNPLTEIIGKYNSQTLAHINFSSGFWLYRNENAPLLTGLASVLEFHYTTTLQDSDRIAGIFPVGANPPTTFDIQNRAGQVDLINMTAGFHLEILNNTTLHIAAVVPLDDQDNRFFDTEFLLHATRRY